MTIELTGVTQANGPIYRSLADTLEKAIGEGRIAALERLPPQRELAYRLGVTTGTVGRAYEILIRRGLARGEVGRGTYVLGRAQGSIPVTGDEPPPSPGADARGAGVHNVGDSGIVDLSMNVPAAIPAQAALPELVRRVTAEMGGETLARYQPVAGRRQDREAAVAWLLELGIEAELGRVFFTSGAQGGLAAALLAATRPGDALLVEQLSYNGCINLAHRLGLRLQGVALDAEGPVPEALEAAARAGTARVVVMTPYLHNPTTATMSASRARRLAAIARAHDLIVIEDAVYGPLATSRDPTLASLAPERTFLVTSISKVLAPALRCGLLLTPADWTERVALIQTDLALGGALLPGAVFAAAFQSGLLRQAAAEQQAAIAARQAVAMRALEGLRLRTRPDAPHLWLPLHDGSDAGAIALQLATEGIKVASGSRFATGLGEGRAGLRISLTLPNGLDRLEGALARVRHALRGGGDGLPQLV